MTDHEIIGIIQTLHPDLKVGPMELIVGRAIADAERKQVAQVLIGSVRAEDAVRKAAMAAERERCAKIAEIPGMTPKDIARAIREEK